MKGYIYPMYSGADPACGWVMTDPIFGRTPTLGACVPNIRRAVEPGDYVFAISGRTKDVRQYVVGGFQVKEKIHALAAYGRFPSLRQRLTSDGKLLGNIIVDANGNHNAIDNHDNFERRIENYIVGCKPIVIQTPPAVERARQETLPVLRALLDSDGHTLRDVVSRWRRLDAAQVDGLVDWLQSFKGTGS